MEDNEIIELYFERVEDAVEQTSTKYGAYCYSIAMNILNNNEDAEECLNDTYLRVWNSIPPQRPISFLAYLSKIVRNIAIDRVRKKSSLKHKINNYYTSLDELENCIFTDSDFNEDMESDKIVKSINDFLHTLPQQKRMIFMRRYWYFDSISDISERYEISEKAISSILFRTRVHLKKHLEREGVII